MSKPRLYLVETLSTFRHRYLVAAPSQNLAEQSVRDHHVDEWQQKHLGEEVVKSYPITRRELNSSSYRKDNATDGSPWLAFEHFVHYIPSDDDPAD